MRQVGGMNDEYFEGVFEDGKDRDVNPRFDDDEGLAIAILRNRQRFLTSQNRFANSGDDLIRKKEGARSFRLAHKVKVLEDEVETREGSNRRFREALSRSAKCKKSGHSRDREQGGRAKMGLLPWGECVFDLELEEPKIKRRRGDPIDSAISHYKQYILGVVKDKKLLLERLEELDAEIVFCITMTSGMRRAQEEREFKTKEIIMKAIFAGASWPNVLKILKRRKASLKKRRSELAELMEVYGSPDIQTSSYRSYRYGVRRCRELVAKNGDKGGLDRKKHAMWKSVAHNLRAKVARVLRDRLVSDDFSGNNYGKEGH